MLVSCHLALTHQFSREHADLTEQFRLCKVSKDVKYVAKGDEDPNIIAWDDAGQDFDNTL